MKKIFLIIGIIILIGVGIYFFIGNGKKTVSDFFNPSNDFGSFFDVSETSQNDLPPKESSNTPVIEELIDSNYLAPTLRQVSFEPISGYTFYATTSTSTRTITDIEKGDIVEEFLATSTAIRFQERATGHVYDVFEFLKPAQRVSNITVQKIYNSIFTNDKNIFLEQSLSSNNEQIKTTLAHIFPAKPETSTASSTEQSLTQSDISTGISDIVHLSKTNKILYAIHTPLGTDFYTSNVDRTSEEKRAHVYFSEFTIEPVNSTYALVQTKASAQAVGYSYLLDTTTGSLTKFLGNYAGLLTKVSPDLKSYLFSESARTQPIIRIYSAQDNVTRQIGLATIPEKCTYSQTDNSILYCFGSMQYPSATYPDDWYKGKIALRDDLYKININDGTFSPIYIFNPSEVFDVQKPSLSDNDHFIVFQNKNDLTLWSIDLDALKNIL